MAEADRRVASNLNLDEVESITAEAVRRSGVLTMESKRDGKYTDIVIRLAKTGPTDGQGNSVRIFTNGTEGFFIDLSNGFSYREFEHERVGQVSVIQLLVELAEAYLRGQYRIQEGGRFSRRRESLIIEIAGDRYSFSVTK